MALDAASQIVALATHGSIHPEHVHRINLNDLKRIIKDEVGLLANHRPPMVASLGVNREVWQSQVLVWLSFVQESGRMSTYSILSSPIPTRHSEFMTLTPDQERIILVSHSCSTKLSWPTLSAVEFSACRPTGQCFV